MNKLADILGPGWRDNIKLIWREKDRAPFKYRRYCDAVIDRDRAQVYYRSDRNIWAYNINRKGWSQLSPGCQYTSSSLTILNGLLTTVGGTGPLTNKPHQ